MGDYSKWGTVEIDRREGESMSFVSCDRCGCVVVDQAKHNTHHDLIDGARQYEGRPQ